MYTWNPEPLALERLDLRRFGTFGPRSRSKKLAMFHVELPRHKTRGVTSGSTKPETTLDRGSSERRTMKTTDPARLFNVPRPACHLEPVMFHVEHRWRHSSKLERGVGEEQGVESIQIGPLEELKRDLASVVAVEGDAALGSKPLLEPVLKILSPRR